MRARDLDNGGKGARHPRNSLSNEQSIAHSVPLTINFGENCPSKGL